jgi:hypothetical protein
MAGLADIETARQNLVKKYQQLPDLEREMLQLYSVIYAPVGKKQFLDCLNAYIKGDKQRKTFTNATLTPHLNSLLNKTLLVPQSGMGQMCSPLIVEIATRDTIRNGTFEAMVKVAQERLPLRTSEWNKNLQFFVNEEQFLREVRIGLYRLDWDYVNKQFDIYYRNIFSPVQISLTEIFELVFNNPFDRDWFVTLKKNPEFYEIGLVNLCISSLMTLTPANEAFALLDEECRNPKSDITEVGQMIWLEQLLTRGQLKAAEKGLKEFAKAFPNDALLYEGWLAFLKGNYATTIEKGREALKLYKKKTGKRKIYFDSLSGIFPVLALLQEGSATSLKEAEQYAHIIASQEYSHWLSVLYTCIEKVCQVLQGNTSAKRYLTSTPCAPWMATIASMYCSTASASTGSIWISPAEAYPIRSRNFSNGPGMPVTNGLPWKPQSYRPAYSPEQDRQRSPGPAGANWHSTHGGPGEAQGTVGNFPVSPGGAESQSRGIFQSG